MKNSIKENWFKLVISLLLATAVAVYAYDVYKTHQPKDLKERINQEIMNRL